MIPGRVIPAFFFGKKHGAKGEKSVKGKRGRLSVIGYQLSVISRELVEQSSFQNFPIWTYPLTDPPNNR
jgi:hypothetical protein